MKVIPLKTIIPQTGHNMVCVISVLCISW
jgi:hypothetical protein